MNSQLVGQYNFCNAVDALAKQKQEIAGGVDAVRVNEMAKQQIALLVNLQNDTAAQLKRYASLIENTQLAKLSYEGVIKESKGKGLFVEIIKGAHMSCSERMEKLIAEQQEVLRTQASIESQVATLAKFL